MDKIPPPPGPTLHVDLRSIPGQLLAAGTVIWSYTGVIHETTLGWKPRQYKTRGKCLAVKRFDGTMRWLPLRIVARTYRYNRASQEWLEQWQITPRR
jgi:hypothetical protein